MKIIHVETTRGYDVIISDDLLDKTGLYIKETVGSTSAALISDDKVFSIYGCRIEESLAEAGYRVVKHIIPNGEASKNTANFISILNFLAENQLTRSDVIVALGGGVVGDLGGFCAASYLRGIHFIQIPTTLLAAVDSSVGGKTGVNLSAGKNLAGAFYQPDLVLCDYTALKTLDEAVFTDGCAEVIKYGIITDKVLFENLYTPLREQLEDIIARCVTIKSNIVNGDELDRGMRQILNFGHTIGHSVEICSNYNIPHGNAVAIGAAIVARACCLMNICSRECSDKITDMLQRYKLPTQTIFSADELYHAALHDKKRESDSINLVVPEEIGRCVIKKITLMNLREMISLGLEEQNGV